jgi:predicted nuclease of predicted toxin-antitoxin system
LEEEDIRQSLAYGASSPDAEILDYAETHGFVLFTHDLDFGMLLAARGRQGSVRR